MSKDNPTHDPSDSNASRPAWRVVHADASAALARTPDESADAMVTDPPAGISFAGHTWDGDRGGRDAWTAWLATILREGLRVLKPGSHALVWAFPRTSHWTAQALDDTGFEIRDCLVHVFANGLTKSHDISKAIDRAAGVKRRIVGLNPYALPPVPSIYGCKVRRSPVLTRAATAAARRWEGWGTSLRPASEHWWLVRRPLAEATVMKQVLATGTGALHVEATRVHLPRTHGAPFDRESPVSALLGSRTPPNFLLSHSLYCQEPANDNEEGTPRHCTDDCPVRALADSRARGRDPSESFPHFAWSDADLWPFRYAPKGLSSNRAVEEGPTNHHPTVKPVALMRWLCRLVTPPGGLVLDPFTGSGTTGVAALEEGFSFTGIERDLEYVRIARARLRAAMRARDRK